MAREQQAKARVPRRSNSYNEILVKYASNAVYVPWCLIASWLED